MARRSNVRGNIRQISRYRPRSQCGEPIGVPQMGADIQGGVSGRRAALNAATAPGGGWRRLLFGVLDQRAPAPIAPLPTPPLSQPCSRTSACRQATVSPRDLRR
jgi:hypothetical protein